MHEMYALLKPVYKAIIINKNENTDKLKNMF